MPLHIAKTYNEAIAEAKKAETNVDWEQAAKLYEIAIRSEPHDEFAYNRAMICYRKAYQYEDELRVIEKGIRNFEELYKQKAKKIISKNKAAEQLSKSLARSLGLTDKQGNDIFHPAPIDKWLKRKKVVEHKLGKEAPTKKKAATKKKPAQSKKRK